MISVVVVTKGERHSIKDTLNSLRQQNYPNYEIIVVYPNQKEFIGYIDIKEIAQTGVGVGNARNSGVAASAGDIVAFIDDDCIAPPDWLQKIHEAFRLHLELDYLGGEFTTPQTNNIWQKWIDVRYHLSKANIALGLCHGNNVAYRKEVFDTAQFDDSVIFGFEDADLELRLHGCGRKSNVFPDITVQHIHRSNFKDFTKMRLGYVAGRVHIYRKQSRELFTFSDLLNLGFFFSLFMAAVSNNVFLYIIPIWLFATILSRMRKDYESGKLALIDLYVNWLYTISKIYYTLKMRKQRCT